MSEKVGIFVSAKGIPKMDMTSNTDPFAVLYIKDVRSGQWVKAGRTEVIMDTQSPEWPTQFILDYFFESVQEMCFRLYDKDGSASLDQETKHEFIGEVSKVKWNRSFECQ